MRNGAVPGLGGTLLSPRAAAEWLAPRPPLHDSSSIVAHWAAAALGALGPASSERRLLETLENLFADLGFTVRSQAGFALASAPSGAGLVLAPAAWGRSPVPSSRRVLRACVDCGADWAVSFNGVSLAIVDARAGAARRVCVLALDHVASRAGTAALAGTLLRPEGVARDLACAIAASDGSARDVQRGLREGVEQSLGALARELPFDAGIAVLFRLLFVLFAEARSLVPMWHALYRDHYSLRALASRLPAGARGTWAALEAGRRLLGGGCRAGTLDVPAFNGRLFAAAGARRWARSAVLDSALDAPASDALASLVTYRPARGGARRVNYAELDVEELGSIYERVLDLDPAAEGRARKESGSFYTPRALTAFVVRRTLAPLVDGASSGRILSLRIVDPAMGSGAFLVAALQYLATALERALVEEGRLPASDVSDVDRHDLRRLVAQRCLYGVDANPTAVMLAKLSVWLATLASGKPLTFLDHRLRCGNSLAGADPATASRPPGHRAGGAPLPLFESGTYLEAIKDSAERAAHLALMREDTLDDVRAKERTFEAVSARASSIAPWLALCDAWCAWWFLPRARRADAREYRALADAILRRSRVIPKRDAGRRLRDASAARDTHRFFHWPLEFPEVFPSGFDAVIGNPPWEMLRAGGGSGGRGDLKAFARGSGVFSLATAGHLNLYQLFVERALQITRPGGRIGLVVPWGLMADEGSAPLRARLLDGTSIDTLVRFDNSDGVFEAHRSLRFAAVTLTPGTSTTALGIARVADAAALDDQADTGPLPGAATITLAGIAALGGHARRIPDAADPGRLTLALKIAASNRALGDPGGWGASFGRELNLTDDRAHFVRAGRSTLPVLEGKHLHPNRVDARDARHHITRAAARRLLPGRPFDRPRLAYRDVTAPTNRQTLIAAIVPAGCVTGHSLFCLRNDGWDPRAERALCAILNSTVANFLVRLFVGSHVTTAIMAWLPVPDRTRAIAALGGPGQAASALDRTVAGLYGLTESEWRALAARPPAI